jgi:periplasmic divalent cation tolerance protein
MTDAIQVITTTGTKEEAGRIAQTLLEERLAACVQVVGPIASRYWWDGAIEQAEEWLCLIKTTTDLFEQLEQAIKAAHSYDVPEILATPVVAGSGDYLAWLREELRSAPDS